MVTFSDESGDSGIKFTKGSSQFLSISLVIFDDDDEAEACSTRIDVLKQEFGWNASDEFHFMRDSDRIRREFLKVAASFDFHYYGVIIDKTQAVDTKLVTQTNSLFLKSYEMLFEMAKNELQRATVTVDNRGDIHFKRKLIRHLRAELNRDEHRVRKIKAQRSKSTNLLQLADYVAGIINRSAQRNKKYASDYYKIICSREVITQVWPTKTPGPIRTQSEGYGSGREARVHIHTPGMERGDQRHYSGRKRF